MTQDPVKVAQTYVEEMIPAFKALDVVTMERLFSVHCVFGNPDAGEPGQQADTLMMGLKSAGLDHGNKEFRENLAGVTIMSAVTQKTADWESDVTGSTHGIQVTAWAKVELKGEKSFYQWLVLTPFEGAENGWTCTMLLVSPSPVSPKAEFLEQPGKAVDDTSVSLAASPAPLAFVSRADPVKIVEAYMDKFVPAFKSGDAEKLETFYTSYCVFGNPDAGESAQQKDVLIMGMKSVGLDQTSEAFRDEVKAVKVLSAMSAILDENIPLRITAYVKVEVETCELKGSCKSGAFYQYVVLVPVTSWTKWTDTYGSGDLHLDGWKSAAVLMAPSPASPKTELLAQPVAAVGDASVSAPASLTALALVATFASGVLVSGCFFGRKELFAKLMAPSGLREPLL
jgi:hypothetical protein